jgi:hypothetical protein
MDKTYSYELILGTDTKTGQVRYNFVIIVTVLEKLLLFAQTNVLSPLFFNFVVEYAYRKA